MGLFEIALLIAAVILYRSYRSANSISYTVGGSPPKELPKHLNVYYIDGILYVWDENGSFITQDADIEVVKQNIGKKYNVDPDSFNLTPVEAELLDK